MSIGILIASNILIAIVVIIGFAACYRELRVMRRGIGALDEGEGRRAASLVVALTALRDPLEAIRASAEEQSPHRRDTVEQPPPSAASMRPPMGSGGFRLDVPRLADDDEDRESDGETRLIPTAEAEELMAAVGTSTAAPAAPRSTLKPVCQMCKGGGDVRERGGKLVRCSACGGSGYLDPSPAGAVAGGRAARLPEGGAG